MHWHNCAKPNSGVAAGMMTLVLAGCGSPGRTTTITQTWDERPRFFTVAEGEERSKFSQLWYDRPRVFTTRTEYATPSTQYQPIPAGSYKGEYHMSTSTAMAPYRSEATVTQRDFGDTRRAETRVELTSDKPLSSFQSMISNWPQDARTVATAMESKYGPPDDMTSDRIMWLDAGPWAQIEVFKNSRSHEYPSPHQDVLAQSVYYDMDVYEIDELAGFHGNVKIDHSRGLLTSTCKDEAMNFLALNLAHDVLIGARSAVEANGLFMEKSRTAGQDSEYTRELLFETGADSNDQNLDGNEVDRE